MKRVSCTVLAAASVIALASVRLAAEQVQPSPVPAASDVQSVRDEVTRLKNEFDAIRRQYDERLLALEQRLGQLTGGPSVPAQPGAQVASDSPPQPPAVPDGGAQASPAAGASSKVFNPDTSVIGNFIGAAGRNPFSTEPPLQLSEAEVAFQAVVDPYARADFYLAAGPEGLDVEEGFITFTALPSNLLLKAGKMRAAFGKVNTLHTHAMPTVDRPLVTMNLVGGEEGLSDSGVSVSRLFPNPYVFLEATGEVYAARSEVFRTDSRSRLNYVGRLRAYRDLTEDKNVDLGVSFAAGPSEGLVEPVLLSDVATPATVNRQLFGIDATFRYRPLRRAIYQRLNVRTELVWSRQDQTSLVPTTAFGWYGLGEYQFARRWYAGLRLDRSGRAFDPSQVDNGGSVFLTFWPTEFSQIRSQYRRTNYAEGRAANELLFQLNFSIGAHGAHAF
jgi:hypothetical protein